MSTLNSYAWRVENFTLDSSPLVGGDSDSISLSIIYQIDDSQPVVAFSKPICSGNGAAGSFDMGRWFETSPIHVDDDSLITVSYFRHRCRPGIPRPV
jgi:hypothetical protein